MDRLQSVLYHISLPALTLALPAVATIVRFTRAGCSKLQRNFVNYQRHGTGGLIRVEICLAKFSDLDRHPDWPDVRRAG